MTWIAVLVSGAWWMAGYYFLDPLLVEVAARDSADVGGCTINDNDAPTQQTAEEGIIDRHSCSSNDQSVESLPQRQQPAAATYRDILFGPEAMPPVNMNINTMTLHTI